MKIFVSLLISFACSIPAASAAELERDRSLFVSTVMGVSTSVERSPRSGANLGSTCVSHRSCSEGLLCINSICQHCNSTGECQDLLHISMVCVKLPHEVDQKTVMEGHCEHKDLLPNVDGMDVLITVLLLVLGAIAAGGGVGGGGIFVPLLLIVNGFTTTDAVPLSNTLIAGASVANFIQMGRKRHPKANRPIIDYNLAFLLQPISLGGTIIGVILHSIFPNWLLLLLLALVLIFTTYRTGKKGFDLWKSESKRFSKVEEQRLTDTEMSGVTENSMELDKLQQSESKTPWRVIVALFGVLVALCVIAIARGTQVEKCSPGYWILVWIPFPFLILLNLFWSHKLVKDQRHKEHIGYLFQEGDLKWTPKSALTISTVAFVAGVLASLLGIGGGMVLSPVMLELHVLPDVTASTSSFMILFTSLSAIVQFLVLHQLEVDYGIWFAVVGFVSSFVGQTLLDRLVKKYNKKSYIVMAIVIVIGASTILLVVTGLIDVIADFKAGAKMGFKSLCTLE